MEKMTFEKFKNMLKENGAVRVKISDKIYDKPYIEHIFIDDGDFFRYKKYYDDDVFEEEYNNLEELYKIYCSIKNGEKMSKNNINNIKEGEKMEKVEKISVFPNQKLKNDIKTVIKNNNLDLTSLSIIDSPKYQEYLKDMEKLKEFKKEMNNYKKEYKKVLEEIAKLEIQLNILDKNSDLYKNKEEEKNNLEKEKNKLIKNIIGLEAKIMKLEAVIFEYGLKPLNKKHINIILNLIEFEKYYVYVKSRGKKINAPFNDAFKYLKNKGVIKTKKDLKLMLIKNSL